MKGSFLTRATGVALMCIGLSAMLGWHLHIAALIYVLPSQASIVFNSALGFFLLGGALLSCELATAARQVIHFVIGTLIIALVVTTLYESLFNTSLGIDQLFINAWYDEQSINPGRMADNSALAFLFAGLALILLNVKQTKIINILTQICTFNTLILGFTALAGYLTDIQLLYSWNATAQMSLLSAIGNSLLGTGLWAFWNRQTKFAEAAPEKEEKQVITLGLTTVFCAVFLSGLTVIKMFITTEHSLHSENDLKAGIFVITIVGLSVLIWQLIPSIRRLLASEKKLVSSNLLLAESEKELNSAFDSAAIGMALISLEGRFIKVNRALSEMLGYSVEEFIVLDTQQILHLEDVKDNEIIFDELIDNKVKSQQKVQRYLHKNGNIIWTSSHISLVKDHVGEPLYFIGQFQNITAEKQAEEQLHHLAYHDSLTGLYNRNHLEQKMQEVLSNAKRHEHGFALIFMDLDRFKNVNDTIGHDAGDKLLQVVAQRLQSNVRNTDAIARIGGDEFVIILSDLNQVEKISNVVQKILRHLQEPISIKGHEIYATTSMGISVYPYDGDDIQSLMKNADLALYRAKELGRNNYQFCTVEMTSKAQQKMARQNAIVQAMAKNEFMLYFQPKLDLNTQAISGVEALLRWHNPEYDNINAAEIIYLAEETGSIIALNEWVFLTACAQAKAWHDSGFSGLHLSVNLSSKQFKQLNFVENLLMMLDKTGFPSECLELEITEGLIMQDPEYILRIVHLLKEKNISIAIDDFGTGYSSLDYLRRFSIDKIKIDRKFIQTLTTDVASTSVVSAIIAMSNKLGIKIVAEGVETREQYDFLLKEKCAEIQGFYLSPPAPAETIGKFLQNPLMHSYLQRASENDQSEG